MIQVDRESSTPVHEQLTEQLRYQIASGRFAVDDTLPSTRSLAKEVGVSFHTIRKAYQQLEREGLLEAQVGRGYIVRERTPLGKGERIERGAAVVREALQRLIALGLRETEIEYLFQEQFSALSTQAAGPKVVFAARYRELAEQVAQQLTTTLHQTITAATLDELDRHRDADFLLTPYPDLEAVRSDVPRADALGVITSLPPEVLDAIAHLLPSQTLGLVTQYPDAIQPLTQAIRRQTSFSGQMMATSIHAGRPKLGSFVEQSDILLYTPACRPRLLPLLDTDHKHAEVAEAVIKESIARLREFLPS
jgi:GntR family transcriptional regulator